VFAGRGSAARAMTMKATMDALARPEEMQMPHGGVGHVDAPAWFTPGSAPGHPPPDW